MDKLLRLMTELIEQLYPTPKVDDAGPPIERLLGQTHKPCTLPRAAPIRREVIHRRQSDHGPSATNSTGNNVVSNISFLEISKSVTPYDG